MKTFDISPEKPGHSNNAAFQGFKPILDDFCSNSCFNIEVKHGTRGNFFCEITKFAATKLKLKLCRAVIFSELHAFISKYDVRANRRRGADASFDVGFKARCISSSGTVASPSGRISVIWISRGIVLDLSDWLSLDAFLGWRLRSSTMVVQTWDKKGREKREKEYVSPAAAAYIQQGAEKRGHLSST